MKSFSLEDSNAASGKENHRRPLSILLIFLVVLFALVIVTLAICLAYTVSKDDEKDTPYPEHKADTQTQQQDACNDVCLTEGCVLAAARIRGSMDPSINPCDDFFNFACGTWLKRQVIPEDKGNIDSLLLLEDDALVILKAAFEAMNIPSDPEAVKKARNFYSMCTNETQLEQLGLTGILNYVNDLMGWPVIGSNLGGHWNSSTELEDLMILMGKAGGHSLVAIVVGPAIRNPGHNILWIDQPPSLGMPNRDYFLKPRDDKGIMAYQTMIKELTIALGADEKIAANDAKDVVDFGIELAKITVPEEDRRDVNSLFNKMKVRDLTTKFHGVKWLKIIQGTISLTGMTMTEDEPIYAMASSYFAKLGTIMKKYPKRTIINYMIGLSVIDMYFYLPPIFTEIYLRYEKVVSGKTREAPRWQSCSKAIIEFMPEVAGRLFVEDTFKKEAKADVLNLVGNLKDAFKEMVDELDWMGASTKQFAKEKADAMKSRIGYPDITYNDSALDEKYKFVTINADNLLDMYNSINKELVIENIRTLRKPIDHSKWMKSAATVNAYNHNPTNTLVFMAAILQPPFYVEDEPGYLKYGGIGSVIGHEMTHGFDDKGRVYDKNGHIKNWWTKSDVAKFKERTQCLIDQYSHYIVDGTGGMTLNGITTQGENIADNGGLKQSFRAYRNWVKSRGKEENKLPGLPYSTNQLYFIKAAQIWCSKENPQTKIKIIRTDSHSLKKFRVYGPMQNFDEFSKAWNCPIGSFMNKRNKCAVW